jgi:hypothetical protein
VNSLPQPGPRVPTPAPVVEPVAPVIPDLAMLGAAYLAEMRTRFRSQRTIVERAVAQVNDDAFFQALDDEGNSIAVLMQHMGGNLRSRFTDFLTTDGEKPDRDRDGEFVTVAGAMRADVEARWNVGWTALERTLGALRADDLLRPVRLQGESITVVEALGRALAHMAQHAGQVVLLARHHAGEWWQTLSIPRGQSAQYNAAAHPSGAPLEQDPS